MTSGVFREFFYNEILDFKKLKSDTIVVFDTNTLLNIYRYSNDTRNKLISAIKSIEDFIWMPYQVGLEFNLNRRNVISNLNKEKEQRIKEIEGLMNDAIKDLSQSVGKVSLKSTDANSRKKEIIDFINKKIKEFENELQKEIDSLYEMLDLSEDLASEIATIFNGRIGDCYSQEVLDIKLKDAVERYENKIPPGYKDANKNDVLNYNGIKFEKKYGDLIVWHQILDMASDDKIKKVVLITDDNKEDWWFLSSGKTIGPRAELKNEMLRVANADLYMLNANSFLNNIVSTEDVKDLISTESFEEDREDKVFSDWEKVFMNYKEMRFSKEIAEINRIVNRGSAFQRDSILPEAPVDFNNMEIEKLHHKIRYFEERVEDLQRDINIFDRKISLSPDEHPNKGDMGEYRESLFREWLNVVAHLEELKMKRDNILKKQMN